MDAITPRDVAFLWLDLSAAQRAVWLDLQMVDEPVGYQLGGWSRIDADIDVEIARQAVGLIMARNDALRLRIDPHVPRQRVDPSADAPISVTDISGAPDPDAEFQAFAERAFATTLPLGDAPLFHVDLVRAGPSRWYCLWSIHHLIADATSAAVLLRRWTEAYEALSGDGVAELAPPSSFVAKLEADAALEITAPRDSDLAYWRARFASLPEPIFLPTPTPEAAPHPVAWKLSGADYKAFAAACKNCGVTTQRALVSLLALLLARTHGRRDVAIGIALHRRDYATRELVGMLAGVLPVRCEIDPEDTFAGNITAIAAVLDKDFRHQRISVDALGRALGRRPGMGGQLFDVVTSHLVDDGEPAPIVVGGRDITFGVYRGPEPTPLALYSVERRRANEIEFELAYNGGFLDRIGAGRIADGIRRAVSAFVDDPYFVADDFSPLSPEERAHVVRDWNATSTPFPIFPLPALFAAQAARTPAAKAISDGGRAISYAELNAASDALAAALQARGVGVETVVGVALHRSAETIVSAMAILKAGGVYLPLDPAYPDSRIEFMARDAGAALVVTDAAISARLPADIARLRIDEPRAEAKPRPAALGRDNAAYIVYTSGSTGAPKGVAVSHASAANLAFARIAGHDPIAPGERVLAAISVGFDVSIGQLLLPLLSGACVVVAPDLRTLSAPEFWALIAGERVTCVNSVPSFLDSVLDAAPRDGLSLKRLMLGGEALSGALCARLRAALPNVAVVNMYGPTEACIDATAHVAPGDVDATTPVLPIGRPLANYRAYVLDARLRPVPPGVAGTLFLGGAGLARGYVGQPGLTASRFVADPFAEVPGGRLYDTGDRATWRADGSLAFLGRDDGQVKIRGFRVELGEVEAALRTHPRVAQAAVVARNDLPNGGARLVAYVVAADGEPPDLRAYLGERLPAHMVPSVVVPLGALPLTTNGKLDRRALPAPEAGADDPTRHVEPATALETQVAAMFADLLGVTRVGATDDFFALGGHSLLATRLISRIRAECGVDLPLRAAFASPTVAGLASAIAERTATPALPPIPVGERPETLPLSFAQERLWFLDQLDPGSHVYVMPAVLRLAGALDAEALAAALQRVVDRHESLRTRFETRDGVAAQVIAPHLDLVLERHDLSTLDEAERVRAVEQHAAAAEHEKFVLSQGPLLRARLLRLAAETHVLVLAVHHIVSDGWSMGVLLREFSTLYAAFSQSRPDPLPPLQIQYADFALWQRRWLSGEELDRQVAYWRGALAGAPDQIDLPLDRPRPPTPSLRGALVPWHCSPALAAKLRVRAREAEATPFMLLLTAFQALLSRWSGMEDIVVGTPIAQRTRAETEALIGFFVNTLALRANFSSAPTFTEALAHGRETLLSAYAHQDLPFEKLVDAIKPERDLGRQPIVQVMFVLQNMRLMSENLSGLTMEPLDIPVSVAKFDLTLNVSEGADGEGLSGGFEYATDLFDAATIERLGSSFTRLLEAIAENPALRIDDFSPLSPEERAHVVRDWNATSTPFPIFPLPALFAAQAARTPAAKAISDGGRAISYAELNAASDALAAALQARGVGVETVVGVALHRSAETIVSAMAILKAGGVYLPLDPAYPDSRIEFMARDAGAALVVTDAAISARLPADIPRLRIDEPRAEAKPRPAALGRDNAAYIVYTSGSTGAPKGVAVSHASAANLAFARIAGHDPIAPGERVLAAISVGFDVSIGQLLLPLLSGACVVVAPDLRTLSAPEFWALIAGERVTCVNSVPSFLDSVLDAAPRDGLSLKRLMLGGEALSGALCARLRAALPNVAVVNMYGPTEACIDATAHVAPGDVDATTPVLPIGRPLANYRAYVLDARLRPVPPGVAGTLFLGGAGLARGYVGQPGLTASRFVADPFAEVPGGRLYDTGDRATWRADGSLAFLGRDDGQVKIRGFRVELGEVEAALRTHPRVAQAAVVARNDLPNGGARLVAYVVAADGEPPDLRAYLGERLPAHMVPSVVVPLGALPLTTNGKLDRRALPAPEADRGAPPDHARPTNEREELFCALFAELTGAGAAGRDDGFFALGGDSISAIRLVSLARSRGKLSIQVRDVFAHPTPAALALVAVDADETAAETISATGPLSPTPLQRAMIESGAPIGRFHQAVALHPPAGIDPDRVEAALHRLVEAHPGLCVALSADGGLVIPEEAPTFFLPRMMYADVSELEAPLRGLSENFGLASGETLQGLWAEPMDGGPATLFLAIHHFAVDGVSWRILLEDLASLCASDDPATASLPAPSLPMRGWTEHLQAEALARGRELALWQSILAGAGDALPADRPSTPGANTIGASRSLSKVMPASATQRLLAAPAVYHAEINDLLLTALGLALAAWHERADGRAHRIHVAAVEGHGREVGEQGIDLTRTVGWFTSLFPVKLDMSGLDLNVAFAGGADAGEAIKRVKAMLRTMPDHGLGYGLLRHLNPDTACVLAALPAPTILFNYLGRFSHAAATGADQWRPAQMPASPDDDADRGRDPIQIEANALLDGDGALHINWTFAPALFDESNVAVLADLFVISLDALATHCSLTPLPASARLIPADFPLAQAKGLDAKLLRDLTAATPDFETVVPLTPLQQGLVFESLLRDPAAEDPYQVQGVLRLEGDIDPETLRAAWLHLVKRHEVLRLAFPQCGLGAGLGVLRPADASIDWRVFDWRDLDAEAAERSLDAFLARDRAEKFDLAVGRLFRMTMIRRPGRIVWLALGNHHSLLDGWSMPVLVGELFHLCRGQPLPPTQQWQGYLAWLAGRDRAKATEFWTERYRGLESGSGTLRLPSPDTRVTGFGETVAQVSSAATTALENFARKNNLTMASVALGAWALLLREMRAEPTGDLVLGLTSGGRPATLPGSDHAVGLFIQTLPLRVSMRDTDGFISWLQGLQTAMSEQEPHGWLGLPAIRQAAGLASDRAPFDALFVFENYPVDPDTSREDAPIRVLDVSGHDATHYPLALAALPGGEGGLRLRLGYDRELIGDVDAEALSRRLSALLAAFPDAGETSCVLAGISAMSENERAHVVRDWNATSTPFPIFPLPALFAAQAARTPAAKAISDGGRAISYAELNAASDALAAALQARGVGVETVVGVALHRSAETIVSAMAILKAGGVYLPLDPAYPDSRIEFMARDAGAALVVTDAAISARLPADIARLRIDEPRAEAKPRPAALGRDNAAYIVYTSGSTGAPKGVAVSHASAANLAFARIAGHDPIAPGERVLAAISVGFDVSIGQLLLPLLSGACVVVAPDLRTLSAPEFWALIAGERVTCVNSVPSFLDSVLDAAPRDGLSLKRLMLGGEALSGALCARLRAALPNVAVVNMYGPTEACIDATAHVAPGDVDATTPVLPIGRPLANYRAYVLDARLRPVPPGVAGTLFLGGAGLARGYVGQPGLTASRFVADPFAEVPGGRLYDTGDRATWRADGSLAFLGRDDGQVKIRGFRVELGEVEAALRTHPRVAQAAVVARNDLPNGGARLVAYVVAADGEPPDLRAYLGERLPAHMVPSVVVPLGALPLTTNGKLDRRALPAPEADFAQANRYVEPKTPLEAQIAAMFADLLGVTRVGATDDFFALGGHSLLATRLISRIRAECGVDLPLRAAFASPTVASLANAVTTSAATPAIPPIPIGERPETLPLSFAQERLWFLDQLDPGNSVYVMPTALRLSGALDADALAAALQRVVDRHEILRTHFETRDGVPAQVIAPCLDLAIERNDLSALDEAARETGLRRAVTAAAAEKFDLSAGPLLRARLLRLSANEHVLVLSMHHIVSDGWSMGVLLREFSALYTALLRGDPDPLPPLPVQYADFALWQRSWLSGEGLDRQIAYWRNALAGAPDQIDLPVDRPRPSTPSLRGASVAWRCSAALAAKLRIRAREADATPFMLLLTAFQALLSRWSGVEDIVVATPIAQRTRAETEALIGFFVNTLALRADFSGGPSFADALARGRETLLSAYAHQDLPFEKLVKAINPDRDLGGQPIVQVMFALQNMQIKTEGLPGLRLEPLGIPASVAKFDLTLSIAEGGESEGLAGEFEYATDLFDSATIERLGAWLTRLLEAIAEDPSLRIGDFSLLSPEEWSRVVRDWNSTTAPFAIAPLPALFSAQAARTPTATAVRDGDRVFSYSELDAASDALAAALRARGVGIETVVGVALHRSAETIVSAWAVLKAGGTYLALDPAYPDARIEFMIRDAGAALIITNGTIAARLPADVAWLRIDDPRADAKPDAIALSEKNAAYIVYTSGSTGTPKGVVVSHASAANLAFARVAGYDPLAPGERVLAANSVGFDVSVGQILLPLLSGACVVVAPELRTLSAEDFWNLIKRERITYINMVPSFFDSVADAAPRDGLVLKRLLLGGEALSGSLCARLRAALPSVDVVNVYGPTETCIDATAHVVPADIDAATPVLPIGKLLANYRAYVLDERMRPVPPGVAGTLFIGGAGLARGYVGQPGLTASRFVADPFGDAPGGRLYNTGDRVTWRADGTLAFLGRNDGQVKMRGFRVELGEVEAAVRLHPDVAQAAIVARESRLVAYVVGTADQESLRTHLTATLPPHMVPTAYIFLDALPLTPNGKLDRRALPAPASESKKDMMPPRDEIEFRLLKIWRDILGVSFIGMHDDFLDLGGDSLSAIRLVSLCNKEFGVALPVTTVLANRTIASLGGAVRQAQSSRGYSPLLTLRAGEANVPPVVCVHPIGGTVYCLDPLARALPAGIPVFGLQAAGLNANETFATSIEEMASSYIRAMREAGMTAPYRIVGYSFGGLVAYEMTRQLRAAGDDVALVAILDMFPPGTILQAAATGRQNDFRTRLAFFERHRDRAHEIAVQTGLAPPGLSREQAERILDMHVNNSNLAEAYRAEGTLDVPLLQIRALRRDCALSDWSGFFDEGRVTTRDLDCDHLELVGPAMASTLANAISAALTGEGNRT